MFFYFRIDFYILFSFHEVYYSVLIRNSAEIYKTLN